MRFSFSAVLVIVAGCTFSGASVSGSDRPGDGGQGGPGDDKPPESIDCEVPLLLRASRSYAPPSSSPDSRRFRDGGVLVFDRPDRVLVTSGNAANKCAYLDYTSARGADIRCAYVGGASVDHVGNDPEQSELGGSYLPLFCKNGFDATFEECGGEATSDKVNAQPIRASFVRLTVDGDSDFAETDGEAFLNGACE